MSRGWVLDAALSHAGDGKVFADYLHSAGAREIAELRLGKSTEQLYENAEKLHRSSTATPTGRPPSGSPTPTSTKPGPLAC